MLTPPTPTAASPARTQDRIWHDGFLPLDVEHVRPLARSAVAAHLAPVAREIAQREESRDSFPWGAFRGLAAEGLFAVPFPMPHGAGLGHPILATCVVTEEIAYESSSMAGVYDGQCILNARALSFASPEVQDQLLPSLISGESAFSFATTEPDASSDLTPTALKTVAASRGRLPGHRTQTVDHQLGRCGLVLHAVPRRRAVGADLPVDRPSP
jgi:alkylation response protein AidB-like acyl-CoA dehydrogenase